MPIKVYQLRQSGVLYWIFHYAYILSTDLLTLSFYQRHGCIIIIIVRIHDHSWSIYMY